MSPGPVRGQCWLLTWKPSQQAICTPWKWQMEPSQRQGGSEWPWRPLPPVPFYSGRKPQEIMVCQGAGPGQQGCTSAEDSLAELTPDNGGLRLALLLSSLLLTPGWWPLLWEPSGPYCDCSLSYRGDDDYQQGRSLRLMLQTAWGRQLPMQEGKVGHGYSA